MTTLIPKYDEGATGAVNRPFNQKLAESISVLDFGADSTGTTDSTTAFNNAIATGKSVYIPNGTYSVANIGVVANMVIYGESRQNTIIQVNTNSASAFTCANVTNIRISTMTIKAATGITGAKGYNQTDKSAYTSYSKFTDIETQLSLEYSYIGFFIFQVWENCRDGYFGSAPGAQTHQAINSFPAAYGQSLQTNLCQVNNSQFFHATNTNGAITIGYGANWTFNSCDFEQLSTQALDIRGVYGVTIQNGWFEAVNSPYVVSVQNSGSPNPQGTYPLTIQNCYVSFHANNTVFYNATGSAAGSVKNCNFTNGNASLKLTNLDSLYESSGNILLSGTWTIFNANISIYNLTALSQNILPIGPTGIGQANFTNNGFTSLADVASGIGLTASAVQFTLSNGGNAAYYTMPAKLVSFLQGRQITLVATGYASGGGTELFKAAIWDSVTTPSYSNYTASATTANAIAVSTAAGTILQTTYVNYVVGSSATSLKVGFWCGGNANTQTVDIEAMRIFIGALDPLTAGLH